MQGTSSEALGYMGYMDMLGKFFKQNNNAIDSTNRNVGEKFYLKPHAEKDFFNEMLILNRLGNRKDDQIILGIVQQFQMKTWDEVYQFKSIIDLCLEVKNFDLLDRKSVV